MERDETKHRKTKNFTDPQKGQGSNVLPVIHGEMPGELSGTGQDGNDRGPNPASLMRGTLDALAVFSAPQPTIPNYKQTYLHAIWLLRPLNHSLCTATNTQKDANPWDQSELERDLVEVEGLLKSTTIELHTGLRHPCPYLVRYPNDLNKDLKSKPSAEAQIAVLCPTCSSLKQHLGRTNLAQQSWHIVRLTIKDNLEHLISLLQLSFCHQQLTCMIQIIAQISSTHDIAGDSSAALTHEPI